VRGYNFSINSGVVEELEIDSFGLSIIPSSLVSGYFFVRSLIMHIACKFCQCNWKYVSDSCIIGRKEEMGDFSKN